MSCLQSIGPRLAILSYGRTGSVVLARNFGKEFNEQDPVQLTHIIDQNYVINLETPVEIIHSHLLPELPSTYCKIFSIRPDVADCILSFILSAHYQNYHQSLDYYEPFEFTDFRKINYLCQQFVRWHYNAEKLLDNSSYVVSYDQLTSKIIQSAGSTRLIYKEKNKLITNWDQVATCINKHKNKMEASLAKFQQHNNPKDIYQYVRHNFVS
jgi:hypothetical protein